MALTLQDSINAPGNSNSSGSGGKKPNLGGGSADLFELSVSSACAITKSVLCHLAKRLDGSTTASKYDAHYSVILDNKVLERYSDRGFKIYYFIQEDNYVNRFDGTAELGSTTISR
ncbi:hypothetical protein UA08_00558 [Talaromyces atroroseus]|uniref:Uncharacterized protein n=1 Tax=Talaromyces atroroseus TaxID=1441469 RepID=A0A225BB49_TALAT|nr:hypothetical protein UA08_00558 [Talaromyces atroroseus]OKL64135.1 hypothetical protein UA08_00558 [Talaromyces atroroseus]